LALLRASFGPVAAGLAASADGAGATTSAASRIASSSGSAISVVSGSKTVSFGIGWLAGHGRGDRGERTSPQAKFTPGDLDLGR
jgi:hypothetical protein